MPPFYFITFAKVSVSVSKKIGLKKVSVSVSKTFGLEKKSRYRSRKYLVSKKSLGLENFGLEKKSRYRSQWNFLVSSLSVTNTSELYWAALGWHGPCLADMDFTGLYWADMESTGLKLWIWQSLEMWILELCWGCFSARLGTPLLLALSSTASTSATTVTKMPQLL